VTRAAPDAVTVPTSPVASTPVTVTVETERGEIKRVHPQWFDSIAGFDWPIK
jgi:hypothetical protein